MTMPFRQSWVTLGQGCVLGWDTTPQPPRGRSGCLVSTGQALLCSGHRGCPGNGMKRRGTHSPKPEPGDLSHGDWAACAPVAWNP